MKILDRTVLTNYLGVTLGALYAVLLRLVFNVPYRSFSFTDLFSVTFVWVAPVCIGLVPLLIAKQGQLSRLSFRFLQPMAAVLVFFLICLISRIEDVLCILIIALPFLLEAGIAGLLFGTLIYNYRKRRNVLYSVLLIPFVFGFIENKLSVPAGIYNVRTSIIINSDTKNVWNNIVRVSRISDQEYSPGFFNYAGIPRPLFASLNRDTVGGIRLGHFEGGLLFREQVEEWKPCQKVSFSIAVDPSTIRNTIFDRHVLAGRHFKFLNAAYALKPVNAHQTLLTLTSSYQLDTNINYYASAWGDYLIDDFQSCLLSVIRTRCQAESK